VRSIAEQEHRVVSQALINRSYKLFVLFALFVVNCFWGAMAIFCQSRLRPSTRVAEPRRLHRQVLHGLTDTEERHPHDEEEDDGQEDEERGQGDVDIADDQSSQGEPLTRLITTGAGDLPPCEMTEDDAQGSEEQAGQQRDDEPGEPTDDTEHQAGDRQAIGVLEARLGNG